MLTNIHLLIREYAIAIGEEEDKTKEKIKRELKVNSFADLDSIELARSSAYVERKIEKNYGKD